MKEDEKSPAPLEETGLDEEVQAELETDLKNIVVAAEHGDKEAAKSAALHLVHTTRASFSGPLPPPAMLEHYQRIIPNAAERIFALTEKQANHRQQLEIRELEATERLQHRALDLQARGQHYGLAIAITGMGVAAWALYLGHGAAATVIGGTALATIVGAFLYRPRKRKEEDTGS